VIELIQHEGDQEQGDTKEGKTQANVLGKPHHVAKDGWAHDHTNEGEK
jgi:hypothetical protein